MAYINKTIITAQRTMIKDIIEPMNQFYDLKLEIIQGEVRFTNGSLIYLVGVDSSEKEKNKLLGQKYRLVTVDEPQDYSIDLEDLTERVIKPALTDLSGTLAMAGTPSDNTKTYFYELTKEYQSRLGWSFHRWSALENTSIPFGSKNRICDLVAEDIDQLIKDNPDVVNTASFKQMWEGQWVVDDKALVYHYHDYNFINELPPQEYTFLLAVDLGWNDANAFIVGAYSKKDKNLYIIEGRKQAQLDFTAVAQVIQEYRKRYSFQRIIIDGANKQGVEEMRRRHNLPLTIAEKSDKVSYIALFNGDLDSGNIKILTNIGNKLKEEWSSLIWDKKSDIAREDSRGENHLSDATLYLWRAARNYQSVLPAATKSEEELYNERLDSQHYKHNDFISDLERMYNL